MSVITYNCGAVENTLSASLNTETGLLLISGSGAMADYSAGSSPWYENRNYIKGITLDKGVTSIGDTAFYNCANVVYSDIPDTVTAIGSGAFEGCSGLENIQIPSEVSEIENDAFKNSGLRTVRFYGEAPTYGTDVFDGVTCDIYVPEGDTSWDNTVKAGIGTNNTTWHTFEAKPVLVDYDKLNYFWKKAKRYIDSSSGSGSSSLPTVDDKTFTQYLTTIISDTSHTNTSTTLFVYNPEYFAENDCIYVKKDSTHFFYGIVSAVNNNTGALTYAIPASDGGTFFSPDDGQLIVNYGNPMNGGVYLDWANDRVDLYQNHTELERCYNIYDPILNINAWDSTTAGIAEEDGVVDVSGNDNHGQAFGGVTVVKDKVMGRCFSFDGVDDYLSFPSMVNMFQNIDGCTFTFKIKINALPSSSANVFGGIVGVTNILSCRVNSDGSIYIITSDVDKSIAANQLLTINDVFSVCFVFDYSNSLARVYINGSLSNQAEWYSSSPTEVLDCFGIGAKVQTGSSAFWLNGEISDFRFFDKALTSEQVKVIYNQSLVTQYLNSNIYNPILNLDAEYSTTASIAVADGVIDVSGNHNNGQAYGDIVVTEDSDLGGNVFSGTETGYILFPNTMLSGRTIKQLTMCAWIKPNQVTSTGGMTIWQVAASNLGCLGEIAIGPSGNFRVSGRSNISDEFRTKESIQLVEINQSYFFVGIINYETKQFTMYINGETVETTDAELASSGTLPSFGEIHAMGRSRSVSHLTFNGKCSRISVYDRELSQSEVYNIYQQSLNPEALENPEKLLSYDEINVHNFDNNSLVQDNMFRLGNLNGVPGISDNRPGVFIGGENEYIRYDKVNGLKINGTVQIANQIGNTSIGNSTAPIYINNGVPTACGGSLDVDITGNAATATSATSATSATNVLQQYGTASYNRPILLSNLPNITTTSNQTASSVFSNKFYANPSTGILSATGGFLGQIHSTNTAMLSAMDTTGAKAYSMQLLSYIKGGITGLFAKSNNANAILRINRYQTDGQYNSELGFSSNGNLYYRKFDDAAPDTSTSWKQIAFTDSNITGSSASCTGNAATATSATSATTATNANNLKVTHTGAAWRDILSVATGFTSASNQAVYGHNSGAMAYYVDANATSGNQRAILRLGNATANTTAAGHNGLIWMYGTSTGYTEIKPGYNSTSNITLTLPSATGTIALTSSNITGSSASCTGNAATATTASACSGNAATATKLATARNIGISDSDGTNTGTAASFNGTAAVTIKLPSKIKASITGNCSGSSGSCTGNAATATNSTKWGGYAISVVTALPSSPNANTIYLIK